MARISGNFCKVLTSKEGNTVCCQKARRAFEHDKNELRTDEPEEGVYNCVCESVKSNGILLGRLIVDPI